MHVRKYMPNIQMTVIHWSSSCVIFAHVYTHMYVCIYTYVYFVLTSPNASTHADIQLFYSYFRVMSVIKGSPLLAPREDMTRAKYAPYFDT